MKIKEITSPDCWCCDHMGRRYTFEEFRELAASFHGYPAPGLLIGGRMVSAALSRLPENILFDAISETSSCLPDAVQLLSFCSIGNGWLKIVDMGRFAVILFDKYTGDGVRVALDSRALEKWPEINTWLFKLKPKKEQDTDRLLVEMQEAGDSVFCIETVKVRPRYIGKTSKGVVVVCPLCGEAYPAKHGGICKGCAGDSAHTGGEKQEKRPDGPLLSAVPVDEAVGKLAVHDMTEIIPGKSKGPAFHIGQTITAGDICRLQQMGRRRVYVHQSDNAEPGWVHENDVAEAFAREMAGDGVEFIMPPREGKINLRAARDGLLMVNPERLRAFNTVPGVMCASMKRYSVLKQGMDFAGTRAIPLYLPEDDFHTALAVLGDEPLFSVLPMRKTRAGVLITGTEIFRGLIQDSFLPVIRAKLEALGGEVIHSLIVPDEQEMIRDGVESLLKAGADMIITTAGLSVDPDDVTRKGLADAGCTDMLYGAPVLPGAMTLVARIGSVQVIGVPACGLYHKTTSFDLLLPRLLAGLEITRDDLAEMGHGAFCRNCKACTWPMCGFGK